jgi:isoleucyl-tRNA synthetase
MLHRMTEVFAEIKDAFDSFQFFRFFQTVQNFCAVDLSNFYLDIAKDRLYISAENAYRRRSCQTVIAIAVENLARAIAPVLCHLAEDIWQYIPYPTPYKSVFEAGWVQLDEKWANPELGKSWEYLRQVRGEVNKVLELARSEKAIGAPLEAKVLLYVPDEEKRQKLHALNPSTDSLAAMYMRPHETELVSKVLGVRLSTFDAELINYKTIDYHTKSKAKTKTSLEQAQEIVAKVTNFLESLPPMMANFWEQSKDVAVIVMLLFAAFIVFDVSQAVLTSINEIPFLGNIFELIGIGFSLWFVWQNVLFATNRQDLSLKVESLKTEILGNQPEKTSKQTEEITNQQEETGDQEISLSPSLPLSPSSPSPGGNGVDELRYLFIASQVELLENAAGLVGVQYTSVSADLGVGVVKAEGEKCDRCWNYSTHVGKSYEHPALCERCVPALAGDF